MPRTHASRRMDRETSTPWFPVILCGLLVAACTLDARRRHPSKSRRRSLAFQVAEDSPLWEPAKRAAETWSKAIGRTITVTPDGYIPIFFVSSVDPECEPDSSTAACSYVTNLPQEEGRDYTQVIESIPSSDLYSVLLHEIGHHLRGPTQPSHLSNPSAVMFSKSRNSVLTPADIAFVCESFDCPIPTNEN